MENKTRLFSFYHCARKAGQIYSNITQKNMVSEGKKMIKLAYTYVAKIINKKKWQQLISENVHSKDLYSRVSKVHDSDTTVGKNGDASRTIELSRIWSLGTKL